MNTTTTAHRARRLGPATFRTHDGKRTAEHAGTNLTIFQGLRIIAELTVDEDATPGAIWQYIADAAAPAAA